MKISKIVLASMVSASCLVGCKNKLEVKNKTKAEIEKVKKDSIKKSEQEIHNSQNCPACGMG